MGVSVIWNIRTSATSLFSEASTCIFASSGVAGNWFFGSY